jgi:DNA-binding NarL/FixJ family response regulator
MDAGKPVADRPIDVIIADEQPVVRYGLRTMLESQAEEFQIVAEAADLPTTIREVGERKPDLLTLDVTIGGGSGIEALRSCILAHPELAVVVLTRRGDSASAGQALRAGARSYMLTDSELAELLTAFRIATAGGSYLYPRFETEMDAGQGNGGSSNALSERECEVVRLIAEGFVNREIAEQLGIGVRTVKTHRARASEKLGLPSSHTRSQLTAYARRAGLLA